MFPPNFWIEESEKFYKDTENMILALFMRGAILGEDALKPSGVHVLMDWDVVNTRALEYLQTVNKDIFRYINETTQKQVNPIISEWLRSGEAMPKLVKRLEEAAYPKHRAEMIAVTEVTRAVSAGNLTAWQSTAYVTGKQWTTAKDERVCPICGKLDGKISDIEVDFVLDMSDTTGAEDPLAKFLQKHGGQVTTMTPPAHSRCRCSMRPIVDVEAFGNRPLVNYDQPGGIPPEVKAAKPPTFETRQEAEAYARTMGFTNVSFNGVDMRATNEWMQAMTYYRDNFPEIFRNMQATGTSTDAFANAKKKIISKWREDNKQLIEKFGEDWAKRRSTKYANTIIPRTPSGCWALSIESNDTVDKYDLAGVYINKNNFRKYSYEKIMEYKEEEVRTNMHPQGTGTFRSDLDHEIGHQLDYFVGVSDDTEFINSLFEGVDNRYAYVRENLSSYAATRNTEMIAEAWSEYMNSPSPRPLATEIGDYIVRKYRRMFP